MADLYTSGSTKTNPAPAPPPPTTTTAAAAHPPAARSKVSSNYDVLLYFVALFIPPVPVVLKRGLGADFCINILLWILGWIPGVIHAWYIISKSEGAM